VSRRDRGSARTVWLVLLALVAALCAVSASSAGWSGVRGSTTGTPDFGYLRAQINQAKAIPKFSSPGPAFDARKLRGKTIFNVSSTTAVAFQQLMDAGMKKAASLAGVKFTEWTNQGQVSQWVQGIDTAVSTKADLIMLPAGVDPHIFQPQVLAAKHAGIPLIGVRYGTEGSPVPPNVTAGVPAPFNRAAKLEADWVILDTRGKADVAVITSLELPIARGITSTLQHEFASRCGSSCKVRVINVPLTEWATKIQTETQSAIVSDPNLNYIIPIFDPMVQWVAPGITASGAVGKVHIASYNGSPFVLKMLQTGNIVRMDVGEDANWIGWANIDQAFRILLHLKPGNERTPVRIWDKTNVDATGKPPKNGVGYGGAYSPGFKKLWGLAK
jgi:ribose transport system substrate-binding protein